MMKKLLLWNLVLFCALLAVFAGDAATATVGVTAPAAAGASSSFVLALIPVLVPLLVALGKWGLPKVPLWILPILAPALGALVDYLAALATGSAASPILGAALGSAGVGVREIFDQAKWRLKESKPTTPTVPLLLLMCALPAATIAVGVSGCAWLKNQPAETVKYYTFLDSWTLSKAAYEGWCDRVVLGKVSQADEAAVDTAWNKYRAAFNTSIALARQDWNAITPASLLEIQTDLLKLIASLTTK